MHLAPALAEAGGQPALAWAATVLGCARGAGGGELAEAGLGLGLGDAPADAGVVDAAGMERVVGRRRGRSRRR